MSEYDRALVLFEQTHPLELDKNISEALAAVVDACDRAGKPAGIGVYEPAFDPAACQTQIEAGFRLLLAGGDEYFLTESCRKILQPLGKSVA